MQALLEGLTKDFPDLSFKIGSDFYWSPSEQVVYYTDKHKPSDAWTLLHEASHGLLQHKTFRSDFELLQLELEAWEKAKQLARKYRIKINYMHIEDCLDTYRDWLHKRSLCPTCNMKSLQTSCSTYNCLNCNSQWSVSSNRLCRPYRARIAV
jgi:hypothetical protein